MLLYSAVVFLFFKAPKPRTALPSPRQIRIVNSEVIVGYLRLLATQKKCNGVALTEAKKNHKQRSTRTSNMVEVILSSFLIIKKTAQKQILSLTKIHYEKVKKAVLALETDPRPAGYIKLTGLVIFIE